MSYFSDRNTDTCVICFDTLYLNDYSTAIVGGCAHAFHLNCIQRWAYTHRNCPTCRARVSFMIQIGNGQTLPVPALRLPIYVLDNYHRMLFTIGRRCQLTCVIGLYEEFLETTDYWPRQHGNPDFRHGREHDVVIFYNGREVDGNATPESFGIKWQDEITIRHTVEVIFRMPDNKWEFVRTWWDASIMNVLRLALARWTGRINIDDYWFLHNNNIISGFALRDDTLQDFKIFSGDVIRVIRKSDVNDAMAMTAFRDEEASPRISNNELLFKLLFNSISAVSKEYKKRMLEEDKERVREKMRLERQHWVALEQKWNDEAEIMWERYV